VGHRKQTGALEHCTEERGNVPEPTSSEAADWAFGLETKWKLGRTRAGTTRTEPTSCRKLKCFGRQKKEKERKRITTARMKTGRQEFLRTRCNEEEQWELSSTYKIQGTIFPLEIPTRVTTESRTSPPSLPHFIRNQK
jgi:hypothetical protein